MIGALVDKKGHESLIQAEHKCSRSPAREELLGKP